MLISYYYYISSGHVTTMKANTILVKILELFIRIVRYIICVKLKNCFFFWTCYFVFKPKLFISCKIGSKHSTELIYFLRNNILHLLENWMLYFICFFRGQSMSFKWPFFAGSLKVSHQCIYFNWSCIKLNIIQIKIFSAYRQTIKNNAINLEFIFWSITV